MEGARWGEDAADEGALSVGLSGTERESVGNDRMLP